MPRVQVYLPQDLYDELKARGLKPSELLQETIRAEIARQDLRREGQHYLDELIAEVGEPSPEAVARAEALVDQLLGRPVRRAG
jgi:hypothetical protein